MRRKQGKPAKAIGVGFCMGILYSVFIYTICGLLRMLLDISVP